MHLLAYIQANYKTRPPLHPIEPCHFVTNIRYHLPSILFQLNENQLFVILKQLKLKVASYRFRTEYDYEVLFRPSTELDIVFKPRHTIEIDGNTIVFQSLRGYNDYPLLINREQQPGVPEPESPHNILNALNDDCLRYILGKLEPLQVVTTADVCQRLRYVAELAASERRVVRAYTDRDLCGPIWKWERFLQMSNQSIRVFETNHRCINVLIELLMEHSKNLVEFEGHFDRFTPEVLPFLNRMKTVRLFTCMPIEGEPMRYNVLRETLPPVHLPNVIEVAHGPIQCQPQFFQLNPQLRKLTLVFGENRHDVNGILRNLTNLEELNLCFKLYVTELPWWIECTNFNVFGAMKHLRTLNLSLIKLIDMDRILQALLNHKVQLKRLIMLQERGYLPVDFPPTSGTYHPIETIGQMKSVEYLQINWITDDELMQIAQNCKGLTEMHVEWSRITPTGILDALKKMPNLKKASFQMAQFRWTDDNMVTQLRAFDAIAVMRCNQCIKINVSFADDLKHATLVSEHSFCYFCLLAT